MKHPKFEEWLVWDYKRRLDLEKSELKRMAFWYIVSAAILVFAITSLLVWAAGWIVALVVGIFVMIPWSGNAALHGLKETTKKRRKAMKKWREMEIQLVRDGNHPTRHK